MVSDLYGNIWNGAHLEKNRRYEMETITAEMATEGITVLTPAIFLFFLQFTAFQKPFCIHRSFRRRVGAVYPLTLTNCSASNTFAERYFYLCPLGYFTL